MLIEGFGLTVTVTVFVDTPSEDVPLIVNVEVCTMAVVFVSVPEIIAPVPLAAIPVNSVVLSLVHVNVVPVALFTSVITMFVIALPVQIVWLNGVTEIDGILSDETITTADPVIVVVQRLLTLEAFTVYVPATVLFPKLIADPVPATTAPLLVAFNNN